MGQNTYVLEALFGKILSPFERFLHRTTAGGIVLMGTSVVTLILANSTWGSSLRHLWEISAHISVGPWHLNLSLHQWVNEGLMTLFFLLVGLELKRSVMVGELSSLRDAALPVVGAMGGMIVPALIYHAIVPEGPASRGWGIPMATDIAFSVGILVLLAWRIPKSLIIFLTALAIADDLGAVLVIALFYTQHLSLQALGSAAGILTLLMLLNRGGVRHHLPYGILGLLLWFSLLHSGIHATMAGVLLAVAIPARPAFTPLEFQQRLLQLQGTLTSEANDPDYCTHPLKCPIMATVAENLEKAAKAVQPPQQHMEHTLSPWVTFFVLPIFALSNAGVDFSSIQFGESLRQPVTMGIILGLVLGKLVGISGFCWVAQKAGIGRLPQGVLWPHLIGVAWLAGIGFTMSLFVGQLAFEDQVLVEQAKFGVLIASSISGFIGLIWLVIAKPAGKN
jgi:Na+:H+ antiporter, NhaA family